MYVPQKYKVVRADRSANKDVQVGSFVYDCKGHDYGLANDDSRMTGVPHISVSLREDGDYPFFTIPEMDLEKVIVAIEEPPLPEFYYWEVNAKWIGDRLAVSCVIFRVVRRTPKGCWITPRWNRDDTRMLKFVLDGSGKRYAYPTREQARESFIRRKQSEIKKCVAQHDRAVRYLALAETGGYGTETEALHELKSPDELIIENLK